MNLFKKQSNSGLWIAAATGLVAAGAAAWYLVKNAADKQQSGEHNLDYLQPAPLLHKKKTDVHNLHIIAAS